jgi:hypothetical protein
MKKRRRIGACTYCGATREVSRDHVVPLCLFVRPYPPCLITVPACDKCNEQKSHDDGFLRDFLTLDFRGSQSPIAQTLFHTKVLRSLDRNSSELLRSILPSVRIRPHYTPGGVYLGDAPQAALDGDRLGRAIARMVRGLYFDACGERFPDQYRIDVRFPDPSAYPAVLEALRHLHVNGPRIIGTVFGCMFAKATEDRFFTLWALWFYEKVLFAASTEPLVEDAVDADCCP